MAHETTTPNGFTYPYLPEECQILYVPGDNGYMQAAKEIAHEQSLDKNMPTGSVVVVGNEIVGRGANGSDYHETHGCERVRLGIPTGQQYELCEGCSPVNHSEPRAIEDALKNTDSLEGADLYLWGHWWCCSPCWTAMLKNEIKTVYVMDNSDILFNKEAKDNLVDARKQFELA